MSFANYELSKRIAIEDPPFYAIIICAMAVAHEDDKITLARAWGTQCSARPYEIDFATGLLNKVKGATFEAYIMAAVRKADSSNKEALEASFPAIVKELKARYNAPGGVLEGE